MSLLREGYTDVNRAFLQAFMSRRVLKMDEIRPILAAILSADDGQSEVAIEDINDRVIQSYIATANGEIHDFDLEIRSTMDQKNRVRIFALINTASDELVQLATTHTPDEIAFFKRVLDEMFDTNNTQAAEIMAIATFEALRLTKNPSSAATQVEGTQGTQNAAGLTIKGAEECLESFVSEGWLEKSTGGKTNWYTLSPRALMELGPYLTQTYNTPADDDDDDDDDDDATRSGAIVERIKNCHGCKEIITVGLRCQTKACNFRLHDLCATQYFRAQRGLKECPTCGAAWTGNDLVGEKAAARRRVPGTGVGSSSRRQSSAIGTPNGTVRPAGRGRDGMEVQRRRVNGKDDDNQDAAGEKVEDSD